MMGGGGFSRHPREGGDPAPRNLAAQTRRYWIPAYAGMTNFSIMQWYHFLNSFQKISVFVIRL